MKTLSRVLKRFYRGTESICTARPRTTENGAHSPTAVCVGTIQTYRQQTSERVTTINNAVSARVDGRTRLIIIIILNIIVVAVAPTLHYYYCINKLW